MVGCVAADRMEVRHWWCLGCGRDERAIGRERMLTVEQVVPDAKYRGGD